MSRAVGGSDDVMHDIVGIIDRCRRATAGLDLAELVKAGVEAAKRTADVSCAGLRRQYNLLAMQVDEYKRKLDEALRCTASAEDRARDYQARIEVLELEVVAWEERTAVLVEALRLAHARAEALESLASMRSIAPVLMQPIALREPVAPDDAAGSPPPPPPHEPVAPAPAPDPVPAPAPDPAPAVAPDSGERDDDDDVIVSAAPEGANVAPKRRFHEDLVVSPARSNKRARVQAGAYSPPRWSVSRRGANRAVEA